MKARQGPTACEGMAVPMDKLDDLVASHLEDRLLQPERLEAILATVLDRRQARSERQREHIAEGEVRIMGSKSRLLQTLVAGSGVNSVPTQGLKWRRECRSILIEKQSIFQLLKPEPTIRATVKMGFSL